MAWDEVAYNKAYNKAYYQRNREKILVRSYLWRKANPERYSDLGRSHRKVVRDITIRAKNVPCKDCGVKYPYYVMHFDHVHGEKKFNISHCNSIGLEMLREEIDKCEVVCANCHAERSWSRNQHMMEKRYRRSELSSVQEQLPLGGEL